MYLCCPFWDRHSKGSARGHPLTTHVSTAFDSYVALSEHVEGEKNHTQHFMVEETNNDVLSFTNGHRLSVNHRFFETAKDRDHLQKRTSMDFLGFPWFSFFFPWLDPSEFPYALWSKHIKTWHENRVWPSHHHGMTIIVHVIMSQWLSCFLFYIVLP